MFIEQPSNLRAKAKCGPIIKALSTAIYLIAITPQGKVSFVSKGQGGWVLDQHLTIELRIIIIILNAKDAVHVS